MTLPSDLLYPRQLLAGYSPNVSVPWILSCPTDKVAISRESAKDNAILLPLLANLFAKACMWSTYKHYNSAKYLISVTPHGSINFFSKGWGGRTSDKFVNEHSGYLKNLLPCDIILADHGLMLQIALP